MFKGKNEKSILEVGTLCTIRIDQKGKCEWVDAVVLKWNSKTKMYLVRTGHHELREVDRTKIKWTKKPGSRCTDCGNESNRLLTQSATNINGVLVQLLKPGEALCPCCASLRGHESLNEIHIKRMKEVVND